MKMIKENRDYKLSSNQKKLNYKTKVVNDKTSARRGYNDLADE